MAAVVESLSPKWIRRSTQHSSILSHVYAAVCLSLCIIFHFFFALFRTDLIFRDNCQFDSRPLVRYYYGGSFNSNDCLLFCSSIASVTVVSCIGSNRSIIAVCGSRKIVSEAMCETWISVHTHSHICCKQQRHGRSSKPILRNL